MGRKDRRQSGTNWRMPDGSPRIVDQWYSGLPFEPERTYWHLRQMPFSPSDPWQNNWTLETTWDSGKKLYMMTLSISSPAADSDSKMENGKQSIGDSIKGRFLSIAVCL